MTPTELKVGDRLPTLVKGPLERVQFVKYAGASGDFNRIHVEEGFAQAAGYPTVFAQGMLSMGFVAQLLSDWVGPRAVRRIKARFKAITWPDDVVSCHGEVTAIRDEEGVRVADVKLWAETRPGTITLEATATVALSG